MFEFRIENHKAFGPLTQNGMQLDKDKKYCVHIFGYFNKKICSYYHSKEQLCGKFQFWSTKACICTSTS